jgi:hypothetical protein
MDASVLPTGSSQVWEVESVFVLPSARGGDAESLVRKVALLKGELVEAHRARDVAGERVCHLSSSLADGAQSLMASKMEHQE